MGHMRGCGDASMSFDDAAMGCCGGEAVAESTRLRS